MNRFRRHLNCMFYLFFMVVPQFVRADLAYVANNNSFTVSVIDTTTNTVITTISNPGLLINPFGVAITPNSRFVYVSGEAYLTVIDTTSNAVVAEILLGNLADNLRAVAITPNGKFAYVTNIDAGVVYVVDTATNTQVGSPITVGGAPNSVAITPDGNYAYVASSVPGYVSIISTATNTVVDTVSVPVARALAITPNGSYAYVAGSTTTSVIDTTTHGIVATINTGFNPSSVTITPDGKFAYIPNGVDSNISIVDTSTNTVVDTLSVPPLPFYLAFTTDGSKAYVTNIGGTVTAIDLITTVQTPISVGVFPAGIAITTTVNGVTNVTGKQKTEDFGCIYQKFNVIKWSPSSSPGIVSYKIYRNGSLIATVAGSKTSYKDNDIKKHSVNTYSVVAVDTLGHESPPQSVTIQ